MLTLQRSIDPRRYTVSVLNPHGHDVLNSYWVVRVDDKHFLVVTYAGLPDPMAMIFHTPVELEDELGYFTLERSQIIGQQVVSIGRARSLCEPHEPVTILAYRTGRWCAVTTDRVYEAELAITHDLVSQVLDLATMPSVGDA